MTTTEGKPSFPNRGPMPEGVNFTDIKLRDWFAGKCDIPYNVAKLDLAANSRGTKEPSLQQVLRHRAEIRFLEADYMIEQGEINKART